MVQINQHNNPDQDELINFSASFDTPSFSDTDGSLLYIREFGGSYCISTSVSGSIEYDGSILAADLATAVRFGIIDDLEENLKEPKSFLDIE